MQASYLFETKIIIVGEGGSGKTTLVRKLLDKNSQLPKDKDTTLGIEVTNWNFEIEHHKRGKQEMYANIWDFGGQKLFQGTHQMFFSQKAFYVLVDDSREEKTDFAYWLNTIEQLAGEDSKVLIVINKKHEYISQIDKNGLKGRFGNLIVDFITIDLKNDTERITALQNKLKHLLPELSDIGNALPSSWVNIRKELFTINKNYISQDRYIEICHKHKTDITKLDFLSDYFNRIGVFSHYYNDKILKNRIYLNSNWLIGATYQVLNHRIVKINKGIISEAQIKEIWHDSETFTEIDNLSRLMQRFGLMYEIADTKKYVIPAHLPVEQPYTVWQYENKSDILQFAYEFDKYMPRGIMPRIIVALNRFIKKNKLIWNKGVNIEYEKTFAEIKETYEKSNKFLIRIFGNRKKELLGIINNEFDKLLEPYKKLHYEKLVPCICSECKTSKSPFFYKYSNLIKRKEKGKATVECGISYENINITRLLGDIEMKNIKIDGNANIVIQDIQRTNIKLDFDNYRKKQKEKKDFIKKINTTRELIAKNETEKAINELQKIIKNNTKLSNKLTLLSSQYYQLKEQIIQNIVSNKGTKTLELLDINNQILAILDELQRNDLITNETSNIKLSEKKHNLPFAIKQIHIQNFRGIYEIKLDKLPVDTQWIFLTGENGYGKTSFLQAIVVGLLGKKDEDKILVSDKDNTSIGIEFSENGKSQINNINSPTFLSFPTFAAYGSSRLMTQGKITNFKKIQSSQSFSLFNDDGVLLDIEVKLKEWFRSDEPSELQLYNSTKSVLLKLLPDISDITIKKHEVFYIERDRNDINKKYRPLLFEDLAAGFRSIIAMVGDIIIRLLNTNQLESFKKIEDLSGIVIIDEFDLHLHPKWQKRFVELLTDTFPKIQFIVSTHSVIPILGAPSNSIFLNVDRTVKDGIIIKRLDINVKTLLPNSLLTSPLFDFFDITQKEYNAETDNLRTEDNYNEILFNNEITRQLEEYAKSHNKKGGEK